MCIRDRFTNTARRVSQNCKMSKTSATGPTGPTVATVSAVPTVPIGQDEMSTEEMYEILTDCKQQ